LKRIISVPGSRRRGYCWPQATSQHRKICAGQRWLLWTKTIWWLAQHAGRETCMALAAMIWKPAPVGQPARPRRGSGAWICDGGTSDYPASHGQYGRECQCRGAGNGHQSRHAAPQVKEVQNLNFARCDRKLYQHCDTIDLLSDAGKMTEPRLVLSR